MRIMKDLSIPAVFMLALLSFSFVAFVFAQYETQQTSNYVLPSVGVTHIEQSVSGGDRFSIDISGTPGAAGSVSTGTYAGNPQPNAAIPGNVTLTHFFAVNLNMSASEFDKANVTIHYTDNDVASVSGPYSLYKYVAGSNVYMQLPTTVDSTAKTMTVSVTSVTDPLFAIGGITIPRSDLLSYVVWTFVVVIAVVLVIAVYIIRRRRS